MTIPSETNQNRYSGNDATSVFAYTCRITDEDHLDVVVADENDNQTTLIITTHYTVSGVGEVGGGDVTTEDLTSVVGQANLPTGWVISIRRLVPLTQLTDLANQGGFFAETHEDVFDYLTMAIQQQQNELDRCPKVSETSGDEGDALLDTINAAVTAAEASAAAALTSETNAGVSETNAAASAVAAAASAEEAAENVGTIENASINIKTDSYAILEADSGDIMTMDSESTKTFTLPPPADGKIVMFKNIGTGLCIIAPNGSETVEVTQLNRSEGVFLVYDLTYTRWRQCNKHDETTDGLTRNNNGLGINLLDENSGLKIVRDITFYAGYQNSHINGTFGDGVLTGTGTGGAAIVNGKLDLAHNDSRYVDYAADANADSQQAGTVRFKVTPNYSGTPAASQYFTAICEADNDLTNLITVVHITGTGQLAFSILDESDAQQVSITAAWSPTAGTEYEIELNWDATVGSAKAFIDGVQHGSEDTTTYVRSAAIGLFRVGARYNATGTSNFLIDDLVYFSTVQHTSGYVPEGEIITEAGELAVNYDDTTIGIAGGKLAVKDDGIGADQVGFDSDDVPEGSVNLYTVWGFISDWLNAPEDTTLTVPHGLSFSFPADVLEVSLFWRANSTGSYGGTVYRSGDINTGFGSFCSYDGTNIYLRSDTGWGQYVDSGGTFRNMDNGELKVFARNYT